MKSAEAWELRGLKIFCVLSAVAACFGLFYEALNPSPLLIGKVLQYGGTGVWITGTVLIARYASTERYVSNLISAILVSFFGLYAISMAQFVQFMADPTAEVVAGGRLFEHTLLLFPGTAPSVKHD